MSSTTPIRRSREDCQQCHSPAASISCMYTSLPLLSKPTILRVPIVDHVATHVFVLPFLVPVDLRDG
eukprot:3492115-Lingulodinium_polyedra.AAC.1